jgi:type II secretory ATPase GspE/PulE/Tfp pilus assembly ATPase PilB-like protein
VLIGESRLRQAILPTAVPRLVNMGVEPYLIAASLRGVVPSSSRPEPSACQVWRRAGR